MGRKSTGEYPPNWNEIATAVKEEAGWCCKRCAHPHDVAAGYTLTTHHLDLNKSNCEWWNLAALCQRCHLTIQSRVIMERPWFLPHTKWFKPYVAGYYASVHGMPTDKEFVLAHLDELIALGQSTVSDTAQTGMTPEQVIQKFRDGAARSVAAREGILTDLAGFWPELPDLSDGVDRFEQYPVAGEP